MVLVISLALEQRTSGYFGVPKRELTMRLGRMIRERTRALFRLAMLHLCRVDTG